MWPDVPLLDCEDELAQDSVEPIYRVARKGMANGGQLDPMTFHLRPEDFGKLSGARAAAQTPQGALDDWLAQSRQQRPDTPMPDGVWSVTPIQLDQIGMRAVYDFDCDGNQPLGHTYIDHRRIPAGSDRNSKKAREICRQQLALAAMANGRVLP